MNSRKRSAAEPLLPLHSAKQPRTRMVGYDGGNPSPSEDVGLLSRWKSIGRDFGILAIETMVTAKTYIFPRPQRMCFPARTFLIFLKSHLQEMLLKTRRHRSPMNPMRIGQYPIATSLTGTLSGPMCRPVRRFTDWKSHIFFHIPPRHILIAPLLKPLLCRHQHPPYLDPRDVIPITSSNK